MSKFLTRFTALLLGISAALIGFYASAGGGHHGYSTGGAWHPIGGHARWSRGYWFHGAYGPRHGWWWVTGPYWYYYPTPIYPMPPEDVPPGYYIEVYGSPPPPPPPMTGPIQAPSGGTPAQPQPFPAPKASAAASNKAVTYYCEKSKNYYPIITNCEAGWVATPVKPPSP